MRFSKTEEKDRIYEGGVLVGWTDTTEVVPVGDHCVGYVDNEASTVWLKELDSTTSVSITHIGDGKYHFTTPCNSMSIDEIVAMTDDAIECLQFMEKHRLKYG